MSKQSLLENRQPERMVIFRALKGLGDQLCSVPALRALRKAMPQAEISLVGLPEVTFLKERFPQYLDELIEFPGWPGMPERQPQPYQITHFLAEMQGRHFDLAIQMHGNGTTFNPVTVLLGAAHNAGQYLPGNFCPDPDRFVAYEQREPEVRRCLKIVEKLGFKSRGEQLEFPLTDSDFDELATLRGTTAGLGNLAQAVCIHPGASTPDRRWPARYFAVVADRLAEQGLEVILTGSTGEIGLVEEVACRMNRRALNLAGKLSLGGLGALLKNASLLICNDTGVSHLADALGVKSIVIFSRSDPQVWAPLNRQLHRVVVSPAEKGNILPHQSFRLLPGEQAITEVLCEANQLLNLADPVRI